MEVAQATEDSMRNQERIEAFARKCRGKPNTVKNEWDEAMSEMPIHEMDRCVKGYCIGS